MWLHRGWTFGSSCLPDNHTEEAFLRNTYFPKKPYLAAEMKNKTVNRSRERDQCGSDVLLQRVASLCQVSVDLVVPGTLSCHSAGEAWEQGSVLSMFLQALRGFPKGR